MRHLRFTIEISFFLMYGTNKDVIKQETDFSKRQYRKNNKRYTK